MRVSLACLRLGRGNNPWCLRTSQSDLYAGLAAHCKQRPRPRTSSHYVNPLDHIFMCLGEPGIISDLYQPFPSQIRCAKNGLRFPRGRPD